MYKHLSPYIACFLLLSVRVEADSAPFFTDIPSFITPTTVTEWSQDTLQAVLTRCRQDRPSQQYKVIGNATQLAIALALYTYRASHNPQSLTLILPGKQYRQDFLHIIGNFDSLGRYQKGFIKICGVHDLLMKDGAQPLTHKETNKLKLELEQWLNGQAEAENTASLVQVDGSGLPTPLPERSADQASLTTLRIRKLMTVQGNRSVQLSGLKISLDGEGDDEFSISMTNNSNIEFEYSVIAETSKVTTHKLTMIYIDQNNIVTPSSVTFFRSHIKNRSSHRLVEMGSVDNTFVTESFFTHRGLLQQVDNNNLAFAHCHLSAICLGLVNYKGKIEIRDTTFRAPSNIGEYSALVTNLSRVQIVIAGNQFNGGINIPVKINTEWADSSDISGFEQSIGNVWQNPAGTYRETGCEISPYVGGELRFQEGIVCTNSPATTPGTSAVSSLSPSLSPALTPIHHKASGSPTLSSSSAAPIVTLGLLNLFLTRLIF